MRSDTESNAFNIESKEKYKLASFETHNDKSKNKIVLLENEGKVGIGTINPASKLEVNGNISLARTKKIKFLETVGGGDRAYIGSTNGENGDYNSLVFGVSTGNEAMRIKDNGNIGIGTRDPKGFKLGVNGKIAATEVKVTLYNNWADFVFYKDYNLPTLEEVANHIAEKGHLKDIPSASEVAKNGIFLGEMDAKLLQKIEELTLYTIQQEKEIQRLTKENHETKKLANQLLELTKRLEALENK